MFAAIGFALVVVGLLGARVTENPFDTEMDHRRVCATGAFGQTDGNPS